MDSAAQIYSSVLRPTPVVHMYAYTTREGKGIWLPCPHANMPCIFFCILYCFLLLLSPPFGPERARIFRQWVGRGKSETVSTTTQPKPLFLSKGYTTTRHALSRRGSGHCCLAVFSRTSRLLLPWTGFSTPHQVSSRSVSRSTAHQDLLSSEDNFLRPYCKNHLSVRRKRALATSSQELCPDAIGKLPLPFAVTGESRNLIQISATRRRATQATCPGPSYRRGSQRKLLSSAGAVHACVFGR
jgi:hypothetical protein